MTRSSDSVSPQHNSFEAPETTRDNGASSGAAQPKAQDNAAAENAAADNAANEDSSASSSMPLSKEKSPVVALGGSAGSIGALECFFDLMPADSGLAFVVILHLSPHHESSLSEVLQHHTAMPVAQVTEEIKVEPNHVYVIAPNRQLVITDGHLNLSELEQPRGKRVPIDLFFRTLAEAHGPRAMCIVLSGANSDGSIGLKRIKEWGGLTIAQDPNEAEYEEMPRAAMATGLVDWVLPVAQMPQRLLDYFHSEKKLQLPPVEEPRIPAQAVASNEAALQEVLAFLRMRTGHNFASYKRGTVLRRVGRRLQVNGLANLPSYLDFLRTHPGECGALLQDLLISVTNFFRDSDAFGALQEALPSVFRGKSANEPVRVWVCGCATGEEAYSVAMLLIEYSMQLESPPPIQLFATDLDGQAIAVAREGLYPDAIRADVSEERLNRFFTREYAGYRVKREVRETILFAEHNVLKDSPFSRLDLVTCRNLLIYFNREAQSRAFDVFHFALRHEGLLFLGVSDSADEASSLFVPLDKKNRVYARRATTRSALPRLDFANAPTELAIPDDVPSVRESPALPRAFSVAQHSPGASTSSSAPISDAPRSDGDALRDLHFELLEQYAPPSLIVNEEWDIVHLSRHAGRFLQIAGGPPTMNLLNVIHPDLRLPLRAALFRAGQSQIAVDVPRAAFGGAVSGNGASDGASLVDISVRPIQNSASARGFLLVLFDEKNGAEETPLALDAAEPLARQLEEEAGHLRNDLRATIEQYEASTEELKASNEELQAANEELRAVGEELETGKEELQSVNEELTTLNQEMKSRVEELSRANGDLQNLMAATGIATIFLDRELRIMRYTPSAVELFNLIPTDQGRPLSDLTHRIEYELLREDANRVLDNLVPLERELRTANGLWYLAQLRPYRTVEHQISGVVLSFLDITERKRKEDEILDLARQLEQQTRLFDTTLTSISDSAYIFDRQGRFRYANKPLLDLLGLTLEEIVGRNFFDLNYPPELAARLQRQVEEVFQRKIAVRDETPLASSSGASGFYEYILTPVFDDDGQTVEAVAGSTRDVTQRRQAEENLRQSEERFRFLIESVKDYAMLLMDTDRRIIHWNKGAERVFGWTRAEALGQSGDIIFVPEDRESGEPEREAQTAMAQGSAADVRWHLRRDGTRFWSDGVNTSLRDEAGVFGGFARIARDATREREAEEALRRAHDELEARVVERTRELTRINHELHGSEERFSQAFAASPLPIFITKMQDDRVLDLNPSALQLMGRKYEEVIGQPIIEVGAWTFSLGSREQVVQQLQQEGSLNNMEATYRNGASEVRDAIIYMNIIELNSEKCILSMVQDVTERKRAEQERKQLMERIVLAQEEERRRISRELHDQMGQQLTVLMMGMKSLPEPPDAGWSRPSYGKQLENLQQLTVELMHQMHRLAWDLRPASLDNLGLEAALRQYVQQWSEQSGVQADLVSTGLSPDARPAPEVETALYRVVQESLTNVQRHAEAKRVSVLLERRKNEVIAVIEDDGRGYQNEESQAGQGSQRRPARLGLLGMGERMELVGGTLTIESSPGQGTTVFARAPLKRREAPAPNPE